MEQRMIDANSVVAELKEQHCYIMQDPDLSKTMKWCEAVIFHRTIETLERSPSIEVEPVIRCKDCKHGEVDDPDFPTQHYCHAGCGWNEEDFYCSYGERKEDG